MNKFPYPFIRQHGPIDITVTWTPEQTYTETQYFTNVWISSHYTRDKEEPRYVLHLHQTMRRRPRNSRS